ncbi:MAG: DUF4912 domain-containing protein [Nitrospirae bacterium]|nr:DUF4912 domain-containing protein [Nitrospirota bacterium]
MKKEKKTRTEKRNGRQKKKRGERAKKAPAGAKAAAARRKGAAGKDMSGSFENKGEPSSFFTERADLPGSYGETRVVLLALGPHLAHVYWDLREEDLRNARRRPGTRGGKSQPVLRFFDVTDAASGDAPVENSFDVPVEIDAGNWYVDPGSPEKSFFVELGLRNGRGRFLAVARSNVADFPPSGPSEAGEERYMLVKRNYETITIVRTLPAGTPLQTRKVRFASEGKDAQPKAPGKSGPQERRSAPSEPGEQGFTPGVSSR